MSVLARDLHDPMEPALQVIVVFGAPMVDDVDENGLRDPVGRAHRHVGEVDDPVDEELVGDDEADADAGQEQLGEGLETQHAAHGVDRDERLGQHFVAVVIDAELVAGVRVVVRVCAIERRELEVAVGVVLDDEEVVLVGEVVNLAAFRLRERGSGGVLSGGDGVEQAGLAEVRVATGGPIVEQVCEKLDVDALRLRVLRHVDLDGHDGAACGDDVGHRGREGEFLGEHRDACVAKRLENLEKRVGRPVSESHIPLVVGGRVDALDNAPAKLEQLRLAARLCVLVRDGPAERGGPVRVVAPHVDERPALETILHERAGIELLATATSITVQLARPHGVLLVRKRLVHDVDVQRLDGEEALVGHAGGELDGVWVRGDVCG